MFQVKAFVFSPIQENTYLLYNEHGSAILIDPGCYYQDERETLADFISENRLKPVFLLNTHCHLDHVFGNRWVHESYGLSLYLHPKERPVLEMAPASGLMWNLPFDQYTGPLLDLKTGTSIDLGEDELEILFAPGHSPGHICFYCRRQGFLIGVDVLF